VYWIDYKALRDEYPKADTQRKTWTLSVPLTSKHVFANDGMVYSDWRERASAFERWFTNVLVRPADAMAEALLDTADKMLGARKPDAAKKHLLQLPLCEEVLVADGTREELSKAIGKAYRRLGMVDEIKSMQMKYSEEGRRPVPDFLQTELAMAHWTRACQTPFPGYDAVSWDSALAALGTPRYSGVWSQMI
jgi:hypothetical protein